MKFRDVWFRGVAWIVAFVCLLSMAPLSLAAGEEQTEDETVTVVDSGWGNETDETASEPIFTKLPAEERLGAPVAGEMEDAVLTLRKALVNRESTAFVSFYLDKCYNDTIALLNLATDIYNKALEHTGVPNEGDYISKHGAGTWSAGYYEPVNYNGRYYYRIIYDLYLYTTAEQEAAVDAEVARVLAQLNLDGVSEYEKVKGIYDYICNTVTYDYENLNDKNYMLKYTAYAAFIDKTAVCQGYATMFYRLALELGLDARYINGGNHAWNIVRIGGQYYNVDTTWDAVYEPDRCFLRSTDNFVNHTPYSKFKTVEFCAKYPISTQDYSAALDPADGLLASGSCGTGLTWSFHTDNILRITGSGAMDDFTEGTAPWSEYAYRIQGVEITEGVTSIGNYAFANCKALPAVIIPASIRRVGDYAFLNCLYLSEMTFRGDAPGIASNSFAGVRSTVYYYNNGSWNASNKLPYGGDLKWDEIVEYTVIFQLEDGTIISQEKYQYGDVVEIPPDPAAHDNLVFKGWDKEVTVCTGDAVYTAVFEPVVAPGDFDGDGTVTEADVIWLLWYTVDPAHHPLNGDADYDGDGTVTEADVIWLLWHTVDPDTYPLK